jgi:hypothetical protein
MPRGERINASEPEPISFAAPGQPIDRPGFAVPGAPLSLSSLGTSASPVYRGFAGSLEEFEQFWIERGPTFGSIMAQAARSRLDWTRQGIVRIIMMGHAGVASAEGHHPGAFRVVGPAPVGSGALILLGLDRRRLPDPKNRQMGTRIARRSARFMTAQVFVVNGTLGRRRRDGIRLRKTRRFRRRFCKVRSVVIHLRSSRSPATDRRLGFASAASQRQPGQGHGGGVG